MSKKKHTKIEGMNLGNDDLTSEKEKSSKTLSDFLNKKTITITAMSAIALSGAFLATNVEAQEAVKTTFNEVSVSVMKTRHSSDFDGKDEIQSDESIQKESSSALGAITATWSDNAVEKIKAEIERQREAGLSAYIVQWGDTLSVLAEALGVSVEYLVEVNNISDRHLILTGDILIGVLSNNMVSPNGSNGSEIEKTISEDELNELLELEEIEQIVQEIDTDGDGVVSIAEARAAGIELPINSDHWLYPYMKDVNEDGVIDGKDLLVEFDKDANDKLSQDELDDADLIIDPTDDNDDWLNDYLDDDVIDDDNLDDDDLDENEDDTSDDDNQDDNNPDDNANDDNPDDNSPDDNDNQDDDPNINDDLDDDIPDDDLDDPTDEGTPGGPIIESPDDDDIDEGGIIITDPDDDEKDEVVELVSRSTVIRTEPIEYQTREVEDPNLDEGVRVVDIPGMVGTRVFVETIAVYSDGSTEVTKLISENVTTQPITEVIRVGTKPIIEANDESKYYTERSILYKVIEFTTVYIEDDSVEYGKAVLEKPGVSGENNTLMEYEYNGLGELKDERVIKDNFVGKYGGVERYYIPAEDQIVRVNPKEFAEIKAGEIDPPTFDIPPAEDLIQPDPEDLEDDGEFTPWEGWTYDDDGNEIIYHTVESEVISRRPSVTDVNTAIQIDPMFDISDPYNIGTPNVIMYAPFQIPVLAGAPIDLDDVRERMGLDYLDSDLLDLSPLGLDEKRYIVEPVDGEEVTTEYIYYYDGEEVYRRTQVDNYGQAGEYFIGKTQSDLD